jgi:pyruvate/2-oxoglutarate dehydrogenase complex dihydrolipoamide dehydrogenase (E3) component
VEGRSGDAVTVHVRRAGAEEVIRGSHILVATGRSANTTEAGLDVAGVEIDKKGNIVVDDHLRTTAASVWALGDCAGSPQFTHMSLDDFRVVRDDLDGLDRRTTGSLIPSCTFVDPRFARVGLNEVPVKADTEATQRHSTRLAAGPE